MCSLPASVAVVSGAGRGNVAAVAQSLAAAGVPTCKQRTLEVAFRPVTEQSWG